MFKSHTHTSDADCKFHNTVTRGLFTQITIKCAMISILMKEILVSRFILITTFRYVSKKEDHNYNFFLSNIKKLNKIRNVDSCIIISSVLTCSVLEEYAHKTLEVRKIHKSQEVPETYIIYKVPPQAVNRG